MKIIGLCGGSGSGKGMAALYFAERGYKHIDTDAVYHRITSYLSPCVKELSDEFGNSIIKNGRLDRAELFRIVFKDDNTGLKRGRLNAITHKHILERTEKLIEQYREEGVSAVLVDAPLLFESGFNILCSSVICVVADENIRIERIMARDGISRDKAFVRVRSQLPSDYLIERSDFCIVNNGTADELRQEVLKVAEKIENEVK